MENLASLGKLLLILGVTIALLGGLLWLLGKIPGVNSLPGTLRVEGSGFTCMVPILASIVISLVLTVILNLVLRLLNR